MYIKDKFINYFNLFERCLFLISIFIIITAFLAFDGRNFLTLAASLIGVTSLIFAAKGNPVSQFLMIIFSMIYGIISYSFSYYGEMITYLGMTGPMALFSLITWLRNPFKGKKSEVKIRPLNKRDIIIGAILTAAVTGAFYFILKALGTSNLILSTVSVLTSFAAVYLTFLRSPYYALAYAANDMVLIALWVLATMHNKMYLSVVICFIAFLANDIYGFVNWRKLWRKQNNAVE